MQVLVGIDIQQIDEVETSLRTFGDRYRRRLFTEQELESCGDDNCGAIELATHFAAKEAVMKLLDTREMVPSWRDIEVKIGKGGRQEVVLYGKADELARRQGLIGLSVCLSNTVGMASAVAVAFKTKSEKDPM